MTSVRESRESWGSATTAERSVRRQPALRRPRGTRPLLVAGVAAILLAGAVLRFLAPRDLWLDEALSVDIARLPPGQLLDALRRDGSPPLWYLLLHYWIAAFGDSSAAVRASTAVTSLATLPLAWLLGRRLLGPRGGLATLLLLAAAPFAVRYASEARMYSLVLLEVCLGGLALLRALPPVAPKVDAPKPGAPTSAAPTLDVPSAGVCAWLRRLAPLTLVTLALALTHYWALFLLVVVAIGLALGRRWAPLLAMTAAGLLFVPQLPTLLFQLRHTGTPWALPPQVRAVPDTLIGWGGPGLHVLAVPLGLALLGLATLGTLTVPDDGGGPGGGRLVVVWRGHPLGRLLAALAVGPLVVAVAVAMVAHSGYVARYTAVALPAYVLLVALAVTALPERATVPLLAMLCVAGLVTGTSEGLHSRTQAGTIAVALDAATVPGDVVVYCPDQLAPAVHRLLAPGRVEVSYGDPLGPARVDWVDYVRRNASLDPAVIAAQVDAHAGPAHAVALVAADGYRTFGDQCGDLAYTLDTLRPGPRTLVHHDRNQGEDAEAVLFPAPSPPAGSPPVAGTAVPPRTPLLGG